MKVRIHLNLAKPERAETSVKIQSESGAWITVAYATELRLIDCKPVVNVGTQKRVERGEHHKTPHAFLEGTLAHFKGRVRSKAPDKLIKKAVPWLIEKPLSYKPEEFQKINYNPRFASCFYLDTGDKKTINEKFIACDRLNVIGWSFQGKGVQKTVIEPSEFCTPDALSLTTDTERKAMKQGIARTEKLIDKDKAPINDFENRMTARNKQRANFIEAELTANEMKKSLKINA